MLIYTAVNWQAARRQINDVQKSSQSSAWHGNAPVVCHAAFRATHGKPGNRDANCRVKPKNTPNLPYVEVLHKAIPEIKKRRPAMNKTKRHTASTSRHRLVVTQIETKSLFRRLQQLHKPSIPRFHIKTFF